MAFFLAIRRCSDLEINQRFLRISLRVPALVTAFRKRRNNCCCDSFDRAVTFAKELTSFRAACGSSSYGRYLVLALALKPNDFTLEWVMRQGGG